MKSWISLISATLLLAVLLANCESKNSNSSASSRTETLALGLNQHAVDLTDYLQQQLDIGDRSFNQVEFKLLPDSSVAEPNFFYNTSVIECSLCHEPFSRFKVQARALGETQLHIGVQEKNSRTGKLLDNKKLKFVVLLGNRIESEGFELSGPRDVVVGARSVYRFSSPAPQNNLSRAAGFLAQPGLTLCDDKAPANRSMCIEPANMGTYMQLTRQPVTDDNRGLSGLAFILPASNDEVVLLTSTLSKPTDGQGFVVALFDGNQLAANFVAQTYKPSDLLPDPLAPTNLQSQCRKKIKTGEGDSATESEVECTPREGLLQAMWAQLSWSNPRTTDTENPYASSAVMYRVERCETACNNRRVAGPHDAQSSTSWDFVGQVPGLGFRDRLPYNNQAYVSPETLGLQEGMAAKPGRTYYYRVRSIRLGVVSPPTEATSMSFGLLPPSAPQNLSLRQYQPDPLNRADEVPPDKIRLQWAAGEHKGGHAFISYRVEGCTDGCNENENWHTISNTGNRAQAFVDGKKIKACNGSEAHHTKCIDDLAAGFTGPGTSFRALTTAANNERTTKQIYYRVRACGVTVIGRACSTNETLSRASAQQAVLLHRAPKQPTNLTVTHADNRTRLRWQAPADFGGDNLLNYIIEVSTSTRSWAQHATERGTTWAGPLVRNRKYRIRARNTKAFISAPTSSVQSP